jgi:hypothetical protein
VSNSLIEKLKARQNEYGSSFAKAAMTDAIEIVHQHKDEQAQDAVERVATAIQLEDANCFPTLNLQQRDYAVRLAKAAVAAMGGTRNLHIPRKETIEGEYQAFWKDIVEVDGKPDMERVKAELYDFSFIMRQLPRVYMHCTDGLLSKIMYEAETIIGLDNERVDKIVEESLKDHDNRCEMPVLSDTDLLQFIRQPITDRAIYSRGDKEYTIDYETLQEAVEISVKRIRPYLRQPERESGWQAIGTAPTDGSSILVFVQEFADNGEDNSFVVSGYCEDDGRFIPHEGEGVYEPAYWMPLPAAPDIQRRG